ncbi:MAG: radical SAM protein [Lachnospiraceae bacterium]|nr:radical SAM protein [Lachnospiraceae bacterium]
MSNSISHREVESHIVLGYKCNHYCRHCVVQVKRTRAEEEYISDLSKSEAINAIKTAIDNGATKIVFTGGEPTLREDLPDLILYCLENGCSVQIQTNGSLTDKIKEICNCSTEHLDMLEFMIPLHSANEKTHDFICRSTNGFNQAIESLKYIANAGVKIIGKIVLTKFTDRLSDICRVYETIGASSIIIAYPHCVSFPVDVIREVDLKEEDTRRIFDTFYNDEFTIPIILQAFPRCFVGEHPQAVIQEEQDDFLALEIVEHQFRNEDGKQWHDFRKLDKRKFNHCTFCKYNKNCEGIWKDYMKAYGD